MIAIALALAFQASQPTAASDGAAPASAPPAAEAKVEPKLVCSWEPVTGTRARKQYVCKTPGYLKGAERSKDMIRDLLQGSGNITPPMPSGGGG